VSDKGEQTEKKAKRAATPAPNIRLREGAEPLRSWRAPGREWTFPPDDAQRAGWYDEHARAIVRDVPNFELTKPSR
jgi:hypothetical protein